MNKIENTENNNYNRNIGIQLSIKELQMIYDALMNISYNDMTSSYSNGDYKLKTPPYTVTDMDKMVIDIEYICKFEECQTL